MYVKVRKLTAKPGDPDVIIHISKMSLIQDLRKLIFQETMVEVDKQRLFFRGKQLNDDNCVLDYNINLNDVIQLMERKLPDSPSKNSSVDSDDSVTASPQITTDSDSNKENERIPALSLTKELKSPTRMGSKPSTSSSSSRRSTHVRSKSPANSVLNEQSSNAVIKQKGVSKYYKVGNAIDFMDETFGAWFEGHILDILQVKPENTSDQNKEPDLIFNVKMDTEQEDTTLNVTFDLIRPRSYYNFKVPELQVDQIILVNYNIDQPNTRGYWYNFQIKRVNRKILQGTIFVGKNNTPFEDCTVRFLDEVLRIEQPVLLEQHTDIEKLPDVRKTVYYCEECKDNPSKKCGECGCRICLGKNDTNLIILCDECDDGYHTKCLDPPLAEVPSDPEWYCPSCKNDESEIVRPGEQLKISRKKTKPASDKPSKIKRDWGRGMACVGRSKECTIVPKSHYGPIPGVDVGTCWLYRLQVSESGVHRPHIAGIHGRETDGAYSIVLSGGYEDDVDNGVEFIYSGSGGRDLSDNKRVNDQSSDQVLKLTNKALALNCNVPLNVNGAQAVNWKGGKPVRVVRSSKLSAHSIYAPKEGCRYDGIYKVVKYYPDKGLSGFKVWKYVLRRDDPSPLPWSSEAPQFEIIYPDGYLEASAKKLKEKEMKKNGNKRKMSDLSFPSPSTATNKKRKVEPFKLSDELTNLINEDNDNKKLWKECKDLLKQGKSAFVAKVEELFKCICCQEVVYLPITTECKHNVCKTCLTRSFAAEIFTCPYCRFELGEKLKIIVNDNLSTFLLRLFPGYEVGR